MTPAANQPDVAAPWPGPVGLRPMLATAGDPPRGAGWGVEFKWDGIRTMATSSGGRLRLSSRNGNDLSTAYPELTESAAGTPWAGGKPVLLDGEIVALDAGGRPDFGRLQQRMQLRHPAAEIVARVPVVFYVFDVLHLEERSLLGEPYDVRRDVLVALGLEAAPAVAVPAGYADIDARLLLDVAREHGLEGIVCKRRSSRYDPGRRSLAWIKTALLTTQEVVIGGWNPGKGRRAGTVGALLLGAHDADGALRYLGSVGTGFTNTALTELHRILVPLGQDRAPFDESVPPAETRTAQWVQPVLVGEVVYRTLTHDRRLRHAAWRGLRPDRDVMEAVLA
jgi:bifunctional non-homologous end joining protein LigD